MGARRRGEWVRGGQQWAAAAMGSSSSNGCHTVFNWDRRGRAAKTGVRPGRRRGDRRRVAAASRSRNSYTMSGSLESRSR